MSSEGFCYQCKYQGVEKVCSGCYAWSQFDKPEGEPKKTEPNDDWRNWNQEDSAPSVGGYYSAEHGHAGYTYNGR